MKVQNMVSKARNFYYRSEWYDDYKTESYGQSAEGFALEIKRVKIR